MNKKKRLLPNEARILQFINEERERMEREPHSKVLLTSDQTVKEPYGVRLTLKNWYELAKKCSANGEGRAQTINRLLDLYLFPKEDNEVIKQKNIEADVLYQLFVSLTKGYKEVTWREINGGWVIEHKMKKD